MRDERRKQKWICNLKIFVLSVMLSNTLRKKKQTFRPRVTPAVPNARKPVPANELEGIAENMKTRFNWDHDAREYQIAAVKAQLQMKDVVVHAGTGMGKTAIAAGPHAHPSSEGKVTLMISPLIALHEEQVSTTERSSERS
jgi:superfamily II DNA helicase RecQ